MPTRGPIPKVPDLRDEERHRRAHDQLADVLNALVRSGDVSISDTTRTWASTPSGVVTSVDGHTGAVDLSTEYQPLDADLTALAALTGTDTIYYRSAANTWSPVTIGSNLTFSGGTLSATGGGSGGSDPISSVYPVFTPAGVDDEFDDNNFSGWTLVDDGTHQATVTESNNVCSILLPGGDTAGHLHAWMKSTTVSAGDFIECAVRGNGVGQNFNLFGLIMADGTTYNSGNQVVCYINTQSAASTALALWHFTGYNTQPAGTTTFPLPVVWLFADLIFRLKYEGSNNWSAWVSPDGVSWVNMTGTKSMTMTPTAVGFFATTFGGASPFAWSVRYFRKSS